MSVFTPAIWQTPGNGFPRRIAGTGTDPITATLDTGQADGIVACVNAGNSAGRGLVARLAP